MKHVLAAAALILLALPAYAMNSNVESALKSQGDLSEFYHLFHASGVADELKEGEEYTIFAPTNTAFAEIQKSKYPCFDDPACKPELAKLIRKHFIDHSESLKALSKWGGLDSIGGDDVLVEEIYAGQYAVEGHRIMNFGDGLTSVSLYRIDGVIGDDDLDAFKVVPGVKAGKKED